MANDSETPEEAGSFQEETVFSLLESATAKNSDSSSAALAYQQRLRTFRPTTYFAKPASISPLVCARFGWTNPSQDLIVCQKCQGVVAVAFHPLLKRADEVRIAKIYKEQLCTAHKVTCPFHANAFPSFEEKDNGIPSFLGSVLPQTSVQLFEQESNPKLILEKQMKVLLNCVEKEPYPLDLAGMQMTEYLHNNNETVETFVSRIGAALGCGGEQKEWAAMLGLFGWEPLLEQCHHESDPVVMLHCPVCLAQRGLPIQTNDEESDDSSVDEIRPAKKRRTTVKHKMMNPMTSHRHYCPIICGFPNNADSFPTPMWQRIATNLLRAAEMSDKDVDEIKGEEVLMNIHRLLQSGLR